MLKITLSNSKDIIRFPDEELLDVLRKTREGHKLIVCGNGIFNPAHISSITVDYNYPHSMLKKETGLPEEQMEKVEKKMSYFYKLLKLSKKVPQLQ